MTMQMTTNGLPFLFHTELNLSAVDAEKSMIKMSG